MAPSLPPTAHFHFPYKYLLPCHLFFHATTTVHRHRHHTTPLPPRKERQGKPKHPHRQSTPAAEYVMSRGSKGGGRGGGLDLKLHLSPPAPETLSSDEEWSSSSPSSCLSSEGEREPRSHSHGLLQWSDSPEATSMVLAACPRCLMYVMLSEADPRCPRCRSPVLLDFLHHAARNSGGGGGGGINVSRGEDDGDHSRNSTRGGGGRNRRA